MRKFSKAERDTLALIVGSDATYPAARRIDALEVHCSLTEHLAHEPDPSRSDLAEQRRNLTRIGAAARTLHDALSSMHAEPLFETPEDRQFRELHGDSNDDLIAGEAATRQRQMVRNLAALLDGVAHAGTMLQRGPGRPILAGRAMFLWNLCGSLLRDGVAFQTGEGTPMVEACSIVWQALGLDGDPRDSLRMLDRRFNMGDELRRRMIDPPAPRKRRQGGKSRS